MLALNGFVYCANNPIIFRDESGEGLLLTMAVAAGIGALVSGVAKVINKKKKWANMVQRASDFHVGRRCERSNILYYDSRG